MSETAVSPVTKYWIDLSKEYHPAVSRYPGLEVPQSQNWSEWDRSEQV